MKTFGDLLRLWRHKRALSLAQLSVQSGINKATLSRWENNLSLPRIPELHRVMDALEMPSSARQNCLHLLDVPRAVLAVRRGAASSMRLSLGDMLYGLRQRSGKPRVEIAIATGVSESQIAHWENDANQPTSLQLHAVGFALGASAEEVAELTQGTFAQKRLEQSREALLHCYMGTLPWHHQRTQQTYRLHLLALLANFSHLFRSGKADGGDIALILSSFGDVARDWDKNEERGETYSRRALALMKKSREPLHFHLIREIVDQRDARLPLAERIAAVQGWRSRFRNKAGQAYLLSYIARAIASEAPEEALRLADCYCALVADNADEYPCRLRDRGNLLRLCGRPAEAVAFLTSLDVPDTFREGLKHLDLAHCLVDLHSQEEARQCIHEGRQILAGCGFLSVEIRIADLERRVS